MFSLFFSLLMTVRFGFFFLREGRAILSLFSSPPMNNKSSLSLFFHKFSFNCLCQITVFVFVFAAVCSVDVVGAQEVRPLVRLPGAPDDLGPVLQAGALRAQAQDDAACKGG